MILVIDNFDSFVHNLARYFRLLGCETKVVRNDAVTASDVKNMNPNAIVISPGPCTPNEAGCSLDVIRECFESTPILGVCLGHQAIVQAFGGKIIQANQPMHGRESEITHLGSELFQGIDSPFVAGRYHSLVAERSSLPDCLAVTAKANDDTIMSVEHKSLPVVGLQFHPESILTRTGSLMLRNFLNIANIDCEDASLETVPGQK